MTNNRTSAPGRLEHINITVSDPERTAALLIDLFDWHVRWKGDSIHGGRTMHVGSDVEYLALYAEPSTSAPQASTANTSYWNVASLNHVAVVVDDLDELERRVLAAGLQPFNHGDYEPGRRFYVRDHDDIEYEIVSYS